MLTPTKAVYLVVFLCLKHTHQHMNGQKRRGLCRRSGLVSFFGCCDTFLSLCEPGSQLEASVTAANPNGLHQGDRTTNWDTFLAHSRLFDIQRQNIGGVFLLMVQCERERGKEQEWARWIGHRWMEMLSKVERLKKRKIKPKERLTERDEKRDWE